VNNDQPLLKPGVTATVRIITAKRDAVLRVPDQALRYVPGGLSAAGRGAGAPSPQVWLLRNGNPVRVPVSVGLDDDTFTELTGGEIKVGDKVIVSERTGSNTTAANGASPTMRFP